MTRKKRGRKSQKKAHPSRRRKPSRRPTRTTKGRTPKKRARPRRVQSTPELEEALRYLFNDLTQKHAAARAGVSVKRFREFIRSNRLAKYKGRRWRPTDRRPRTVSAFTTSGRHQITVRGYIKSRLVMQHRAAVYRFFESNDPSHLKPFEGRTVNDSSGREHTFETRPNVLYRMNAAGGEPYEQIYKLST